MYLLDVLIVYNWLWPRIKISENIVDISETCQILVDINRKLASNSRLSKISNKNADISEKCQNILDIFDNIDKFSGYFELVDES